MPSYWGPTSTKRSSMWTDRAHGLRLQRYFDPRRPQRPGRGLIVWSLNRSAVAACNCATRNAHLRTSPRAASHLECRDHLGPPRLSSPLRTDASPAPCGRLDRTARRHEHRLVLQPLKQRRAIGHAAARVRGPQQLLRLGRRRHARLHLIDLRKMETRRCRAPSEHRLRLHRSASARG